MRNCEALDNLRHASRLTLTRATLNDSDDDDGDVRNDDVGASRVAVRAVRDFAERTRTQVVLLTCHPAQKQLFDQPLA